MAGRFSKTVRRMFVRTSFATVVFASATCYAYRPRPTWETEYYKNMRGRQPSMSGPERWLASVGQAIAVGSTMTALKIFMFGLNTTDIAGYEKLEDALANRGDRGLITVANHVSILDDPGVVSALLPYSVLWRPNTMRWSMCSEELCFFHPAVGTFMGAGRVLPVRRGGSIFQKVLVDYQQAMERGEWAHIFPEGRVWQEGGTPYRDEQGRWCSDSGRCGKPYSKLGPMKWGIAKVIANADKTPMVLPFYHLGMEEVIPQAHNNEIVSRMPRLGKHITVQFGDPINFDDLIKAYHAGAAARAKQRSAQRAAAQRLGRKDSSQGGKGSEEAKSGSAAPVMEVCAPPSRFRLRVVPPDHAELTEEELAQEAVIRLQLYSDIASRIADVLTLLEDRVRDKRRLAGLEHLDDKQW